MPLIMDVEISGACEGLDVGNAVVAGGSSIGPSPTGNDQATSKETYDKETSKNTGDCRW
jgi:hypothetical protein